MSNEPIREPLLPSNSEIFTLHDLVYRLSLRAQAKSPTDGGIGVRSNQLLVRAVQDAVRDLGSKHDWSYYQRKLRFTTSAQVSGAFTLDFDGSAGNPLVTLTGAEDWPADAIYGEIVIGEIPYKIFTRIDNKNISLMPSQGLTANATGTLTWRRTAYRLNREISRVHYIRNLTTDKIVHYSSANDQNELSYLRTSGGTANRISIQNVSMSYGATDFVVWPAPINQETYELSVTVAPQTPLIPEISNTDGVVTSGSNVFTSAAGGFTPYVVGSLLKLSSSAMVPSEQNGPFFTWRAFVTGYTSPTSLVLSDAALETAAGRGFLISSPIDISSGTMLGYVESESYSQYCRNHNHTGLPVAMQLARQDLISAIGQDNMINRSRNVTVGHWLNSPFFDTYTQSVF